MSDDKIYGREERLRAAGLPEMELRRRVDRLLEQAARELAHPAGTERSGMLHAGEIFWLLGVGPWPGAEGLARLESLLRSDTGKDTPCRSCPHSASLHDREGCTVMIPQTEDPDFGPTQTCPCCEKRVCS